LLQDVDDSQSALHALTRLAFVEKWSLVCAWSRQEVARYIETFKLYEHKPADLIQGRTDDDYTSKLTGCLTAVRLVNKTDVVTLASTFGTLKDVMTAPPHEIKLCPGIGELKATRLADTFRTPFLTKSNGKPGAASGPEGQLRRQSNLQAVAASAPAAGHTHQEFQRVLGQYAQLGLVVEPAKLVPCAQSVYSSNAGGKFTVAAQAQPGTVSGDAVVLKTGSRSNLVCVMVNGDAAGLEQWEALQESLPPPAPVYLQPSGTIVLVRRFFEIVHTYIAHTLSTYLDVRGIPGIILTLVLRCCAAVYGV
jgi:hypothetical protein